MYIIRQILQQRQIKIIPMIQSLELHDINKDAGIQSQNILDLSLHHQLQITPQSQIEFMRHPIYTKIFPKTAQYNQ